MAQESCEVCPFLADLFFIKALKDHSIAHGICEIHLIAKFRFIGQLMANFFCLYDNFKSVIILSDRLYPSPEPL